MPFKYPSLIDRIIANSVPSTENFYGGTPCWEWIGRVTENRNGTRYPRMAQRVKSGSRKGKVSMEFVHRVVIRNIKGRRLTRGNVAMHLCNNTICVNPDHLAGGTQSENMKQMVRENRRRARAAAPEAQRMAA